MSKKKIEKMQKEYTKPQLTRWERQHRMQRIIFYSGVGLIALVVLGLVAAWFISYQLPYYRTVIEVNGHKIKMSQYVKTLRAFAKGVSADQIANYAYYVSNILEQSEIIRQGAAEQNITVTDSEVAAKLAEGELEEGYAPLIRAQMLSEKMREEYIKPQVVTTAVQRNIEVMFLESESQAAEIRAKIEAGESFGDLAAANSLDSYSQSNGGEIGWHVQDVFTYLLGSSVPGDFAFAESTQDGQLSQPRPDTEKEKQVGYWLIMLIEKGSDDLEGQINVRVMLLSSEEEANQVRKEIVENGADFKTLADEKSQYDTGGKNGGLVGFISEGTMSTVFDEAAFALEVGEISQPVKDTTQSTTGGSWLVKVLESASDKEISGSDIDIVVNNLFESWLIQAQAVAVVNNYFTDASWAWAIEKATGY